MSKKSRFFTGPSEWTPLEWGMVIFGFGALYWVYRKNQREIEAQKKARQAAGLTAEFEEIHREQYRGYTIVVFGRGAIVWEVRDGTDVVARGSVGPSDEDLSEDIAQAIAEARAYVDALEGT